MAKILLVEDDNNLREIYEARLQAEGYTIVSAQDGEEALVVAKAEKPDLIISDVMMPKISGFEMLDILRNTEGLQHVKVIMLTALGQADDQQRATKLGADRYLVKSQVTLEDIVKTAHDLLADEAASEPTVPGATAEPTPVTPAPAAPTPTPVPTTAPPVSATPATPPAAPEAPIQTPPPATPSTAAPTPAVTTPAPATPVTPAPEPTSAPVTPTPEPAQPQTAPQTNPAPEPAQASSPEAEKKTDTSGAETADDKLMDDAVNALIAETERQKKDESATPGETVKPDDQADTSKTDEKDTAPADKDSEEASEKPKIKTESSALNKPSESDSDKEGASGAPSSDQVPIAHKKIIKPLEGEPKKDINELLALEEAKEAGATAPPVDTGKSEEEKEAEAEEALEAAKSAVAASSTSQEEAGVEARIEDFVAGATTEPSQPGQPAKPAEDTAAQPTTPPATQPAPEAPSAPPTQPVTAPAPTAPASPPEENKPQSPGSDSKASPDPNTIAL